MNSRAYFAAPVTLAWPSTREVGVPMPSAWISDVPGYSWGVVPAMVQNGIKYFSLGTNTGDRIGHIICDRLAPNPNRPEPIDQEVVIDPEFVVRASTGPART